MIRREGDVGRARNFKEMQPIKIHGVYKGSYACKGCGWLGEIFPLKLWKLIDI